MKRYNISDYIEVGKIHMGTPAAFIGLNKITKKRNL